MKNERLFDEEKILEFKETGNERIFEEIISSKDIKNYVYYVCNQKLRNYPSSLLSLDDFINISYLVIWQSIQKYKFICPECGIKSKSRDMYKLHMVTKHGEYSNPKISISRYIKFNLGAYLQNELKKEYSEERKSNVMTINIFSPGVGEEEDDNTNVEKEQSKIQTVNIENEVIFAQELNLITDKFDAFSKEIFHYLYNCKMKQIDIANILYNEKKYSSEQSAAVVISRTIKNKISPIIELYYKENI